MKRPIIGITRSRKPEDYEQAIRTAGGEPKLLDWDRTSPSEAIREIDGLVLTGGGDVDPKHYGESITPEVKLAEPGRDEFEIALANAALERDMPILAICRGLQVLNVAAGGTLVQHVPDVFGDTIEHAPEDGSAKTRIAHDIRVTPASALARALGPTIGAVETCAVNSRHHQAVRDVAPGFVISATAPDGIIEAIERPDKRFCLGVEWHPENFWESGEFRPLFESFVTACQTPSTRK